MKLFVRMRLSKISKLMTYQDMEFFIQQNIFRLEISVNDSQLMNVFNPR